MVVCCSGLLLLCRRGRGRRRHCRHHRRRIFVTLLRCFFIELSYRAKTIKNSVKVNKQKSAAEMAALIATLKKELSALQAYNVSLEKQIEFMKSPEYDPAKPLPKVKYLRVLSSFPPSLSLSYLLIFSLLLFRYLSRLSELGLFSCSSNSNILQEFLALGNKAVSAVKDARPRSPSFKEGSIGRAAG